ncbi:MAG: N-acetyltransferase [Micavibrio aeruginosavorus]|uniref:N-acetyltransferase n=1 Tax=Micavibrio aeruginosavorus TaxID=349221 RepID=A0A2W5N2A2_9BACT|nr:MAG: N-acetyltransferase [Micavibrio aeruginosavorus]
MATIKDNKTAGRYELEESGHVAHADYRKENGTLYIKYVEAPEALRGTGAAGRLMEGVTAVARAENLKIMPICGYAASWLRKHKEHHDLMA